jgi:hypothetical protein
MNQWWNPLKRVTPAQIWQIWAGQQQTRSPIYPGERTDVGNRAVGAGATRKACGVLVDGLQGKSWAPTPSTGQR